jgi:hypothetical protein
MPPADCTCYTLIVNASDLSPGVNYEIDYNSTLTCNGATSTIPHKGTLKTMGMVSGLIARRFAIPTTSPVRDGREDLYFTPLARQIAQTLLRPMARSRVCHR